MTHKTKAAVAALALALLAAGSATAADRMIDKKDLSELASSNAGQPYWSMQAQCAGFFGAAYQFRKDTDPAKAEEYKQFGVRFLNDAVQRLYLDRGLDQAHAIDLAAPQVEIGRAQARGMLYDHGDNGGSSWNQFRSICLDIDDAYHHRELVDMSNR